MKISVFGLAIALLLVGASGAIAADPGLPHQQSGVSSSPGVVGGRVPAETPPSTGSCCRAARGHTHTKA